MSDYAVAPWVVIVVIVLSVWRAFHGPYSDEWWLSTTQWLHQRLVRRRLP
jgi:hypothetical protein